MSKPLQNHINGSPLPRVCKTGKIVYSNRANAVRAIRRQMKKGRWAQPPAVYKCPICDGWHIGRKHIRVAP